MTDWVWLNHEWVPHDQAHISIMDRGFLFGDSVYEVVPYYKGRPLHLHQHLERLQQSLKAIRCLPSELADEKVWIERIKQLLTKNDATQNSAIIYIQVTRGVENTRRHRLPDNPDPTVVMFLLPFDPPSIDRLANGVSAITMLDQRWAMCHIKTTALLSNLMLLDQAHQQHVNEGIFTKDGYVTESTSSNILMVNNQIIMTPVADNQVLNGITRRLVMDLAQKAGYEVRAEPITEATLLDADEIWLTSASKEITPVLSINHQPVGTGSPGPVWHDMIQHYHHYLEQLPALLNE